jgi:AP-4 complex subunit mu-1
VHVSDKLTCRAGRISNIFKDYCGVLTEESIRVNFVLIYELLDEVIDFG